MIGLIFLAATKVTVVSVRIGDFISLAQVDSVLSRAGIRHSGFSDGREIVALADNPTVLDLLAREAPEGDFSLYVGGAGAGAGRSGARDVAEGRWRHLPSALIDSKAAPFSVSQVLTSQGIARADVSGLDYYPRCYMTGNSAFKVGFEIRIVTSKGVDWCELMGERRSQMISVLASMRGSDANPLISLQPLARFAKR